MPEQVPKKQKERIFSLDEILNAKPGTLTNQWEGQGSGDVNDEEYMENGHRDSEWHGHNHFRIN